MNKLFKLIYVNLLSLFDINKIVIAREDGVKSNLEKKLIITGLMAIVYGYFIYMFLKMLNVDNKYYLLSFGFIVSTFVCLISNILVIESTIFKSEDNDLLFTLPVNRYHILFSKLFTIYLKNLFTIFIVMGSSFLVFYELVKVTETMVLMYILTSLIIPLIPMIIATLIAYLSDYYKIKYNNSFKYKILKCLVLIIIFGIFILLFKNIRVNNLNILIQDVMSRINCIYPINYLFYIVMKNGNIIVFISLMLVPIIFMYLYMMFINNNYSKICSLLRGVKKKEIFKYKRSLNLHKVFGIVKKEFINLFSNKLYLSSSYSILLFFTILLVIFLNVFNFKEIIIIEEIKYYMDMFIPTILGMIASLGCSTIVSMSLEKDNMQILRTMPIGMGKIILGKWLTNIIVGSIFILVNGIILSIYVEFDIWMLFFTFLFPLIALMFVSFTGIVLDYRFIEKNNSDDNVIIRQRILNMIPTCISLIIGFSPLFVDFVHDYRLLLGSYMLIMFIGFLIEIIYLIINKNKLLKSLLK